MLLTEFSDAESPFFLSIKAGNESFTFVELIFYFCNYLRDNPIRPFLVVLNLNIIHLKALPVIFDNVFDMFLAHQFIF